MNKNLAIISSSIALFLSTAPLAFAVDVCPGGQFDPLCKLNISNDSSIVSNIFSILFVVAVFLSIGFLIWGGIKWIMSGGDKGKVDAARGTITAAVVGLIIAFLAFFIVGAVSFFFGLETDGGPSFSLPKLSGS